MNFQILRLLTFTITVTIFVPSSASDHEFFADIFSGLFHKDMNKVGDNFSELGPTFSTKSDLRRFIPQENIESSDSWHKYGPHHFFTPARHAIGQLDMNKVIAAGKEKLFLNKLIDHLLQEIQRLIESATNDEFISYSRISDIVDKAKDYQPIEIEWHCCK